MDRRSIANALRVRTTVRKNTPADTPHLHAQRAAWEREEFERRRQEQLAAAEAFDREPTERPRPEPGHIVGSQRRPPIRTSAPATGSVSTERMAEDLARLARELGWE